MFCEKCGAVLLDGASFCEKCGSPVTGKMELDQAKMSEEKVKTKKGKTGYTVLSVILCILIVFLGSFSSIIFLTRHAVNEEAVDNLVNNFDLADLRMGFTEGGKGSQTLADYIVKNQDNFYMLDIEKEKIEKLLTEKFIQKFAAKKANDYIEDLFHDTGDGVITAKELKKLWTSNADKIYEVTGARWSEEELQFNLERMEEEGLLEGTDLSVYRDEHAKAFLLIRILLSYWMGVTLLIFAILLTVSTFMIQEKISRGFSFMGSSLILIGVVNLLIGILATTLASLLNSHVNLGRSFWNLMFESVRTTGFITAAILISTGILSWVIYILIKNIQMKKAN